MTIDNVKKVYAHFVLKSRKYMNKLFESFFKNLKTTKFQNLRLKNI